MKNLIQMLLISCYLSWNSPSLHIAGTSRPALIDVLFQFSTLLKGGSGRSMCQNSKMVVDVFQQPYSTKTGMSTDCNVTQLKIIGIHYVYDFCFDWLPTYR